MASQHPQIGAWYLDQVADTLFEIVAIEDHFGTIEIQFENGDIDEMDIDQWDNKLFSPSSAPEDSLSAYGMSSDDTWDDDMSSVNPLESDSGLFDLDGYQDFDDLV